MCKRMILLAASAALACEAAAAPPVPAHAGPQDGQAVLAGACAAPAEPALKSDRALKGLAAVRAHNDAVRAYNAHVAAVNAYLRCIADEAARELDLYYLMVTARHEAKQAAALDRLDVLRQELKLPAR
jgi:hypothetical protein